MDVWLFMDASSMGYFGWCQALCNSIKHVRSLCKEDIFMI